MLQEINNVITDLTNNRIIVVLLILLAAYVAIRLVMVLVERLVRRAIRPGRYKTQKDEKQREDTLISILRTGLNVAIWAIAVTMVMSEFGINVGPLLAGAGVLGVALGFGAQSIVKDYLAGFFIIAENQYRVGDVLQVNQSIAGIVEQVTLRATVLRDLNGMVHHVPNGNIEVATNMTMEYAKVDLNIGVGYETDIDALEALINATGQKIYEDEKWKDIVLEAPSMLRVDEFADSAIIVKVVCKTAPIHQWEVKSEILRRLKKVFDKEGIVIPYPQRTIHQAKK